MDWINLAQDGVLWNFLGNGNELLGAKIFLGSLKVSRGNLRVQKFDNLSACELVQEDCEHKSSVMCYFR